MSSSNPSYTVVGTPFSTFTRTITLGLQYKGLKYNQISTVAHSQVASDSHPFGYLPTLIIKVDGSDRPPIDIKLSESQAIVRYLDRIAPEPTLQLVDGNIQPLPEKMWEFVSLTASFGFPIIEGGVVKPRVQALDEGKLSENEVREQIKAGVVKLKDYLKLVESLMGTEGYLFGDKPTWADFFLFPLLADLRTVPEWEVASQRLIVWMTKMDELPAVKETSAGTLSVGARPA